MSHILDALQKLQEEKTAKLKQAAVTGGVLLDPSVPRRRSSRRRLPAVIGAAVLLLAGAVTLWLLFRHVPQPLARPQAGGKDWEAVRTVTPSGPLAVMPMAATPTPPPPRPHPTIGAAPAIGTTWPPNSRRVQRRHPSPPATTLPTPPPPPASTAVTGTPDGIKLSGIAWNDSRRMRRVVLNDTLVGEGAEVAGAKVLEIKPTIVRLEKNGTLFEVPFPH